MDPITTDRVSTEKKTEHIEKHTERELEQLYPELSIRPDQPTLCAQQQKGLESTRSPHVAVTIDDLPTEVIHHILKYLKFPTKFDEYDHPSFYSSLKVCHRWRMIGIEIVYGRSTRDWSPKRWAVIYKVLKHHEARVMKLRADKEAWDLLRKKQPRVSCEAGGFAKFIKQSA